MILEHAKDLDVMPEPTHFDFNDGNGPVPAKRHVNPDGSTGGWVADTANVDSTAYIGKNAKIYGHVYVKNRSKIVGFARVCDDAYVEDDAIIRDDAIVSGYCQISGNARIENYAKVFGDAQVKQNARILDHATVGDYVYIGDKAIVKDYAELKGCVALYGEIIVCGIAKITGSKHMGDMLQIRSAPYVINQKATKTPLFLMGHSYTITIMDEHIHICANFRLTRSGTCKTTQEWEMCMEDWAKQHGPEGESVYAIKDHIFALAKAHQSEIAADA